MRDEQKPVSLKDCIDTTRKLVRCVCPNGHVFAARIYVAINKATDSQALDEISTTGLQTVQCHLCTATCQLAEPFTLNDPQNKKFALYIPSVLAHKELELRARLTADLAQTDLDEIPFYFLSCQILLGQQGLLGWMDNRDPFDTQEELEQPRIHEAFADLLTTKSAPPPPFVDPDLDLEERDDFEFEETESQTDAFSDLNLKPSSKKNVDS